MQVPALHYFLKRHQHCRYKLHVLKLLPNLSHSFQENKFHCSTRYMHVMITPSIIRSPLANRCNFNLNLARLLETCSSPPGNFANAFRNPALWAIWQQYLFYLRNAPWYQQNCDTLTLPTCTYNSPYRLQVCCTRLPYTFKCT